MKREITQLMQLDPNLIHAHILFVYSKEASYMEQLIDAVKLSYDEHKPLILVDSRAHYEQIVAQLRTENQSIAKKFLRLVDFSKLIGKSNLGSRIAKYHRLMIQALKQGANFHLWFSCAVSNFDTANQLAEWLVQTESARSLTNFSGWSVYAFREDHLTALNFNRLKQHFNFYMSEEEFVHSDLFQNEHQPMFLTDKSIPSSNGKLAVDGHQLETFIRNYFDPILLLDEEDRVDFINKAYTRVFQWSEDELIGIPYSQLPSVPREYLFEVHRDRNFTLLNQPVLAYQTQLVKKDGQRIDVMLTSFPLKAKSGRIDGRAVILSDKTEKNKAISALLKAEQLTIAGELAQGIARELLQPITTIKGFAQLLSGSNKGNSGYFSVINSEIDRVVKILRELLPFADANLQTLQPENIVSLLSDVILLMEPQARLQHVHIIFNSITDLFFVTCDRSQLKQAFINYIKNAIEAMKNGGKLTITCELVQRRRLTITFCDEGAGIPEDVLAKIGRPFFTTKENGTGLGFIVSKRIVESFGGTIQIKSQINRGTTVQLIFPCSGTESF